MVHTGLSIPPSYFTIARLLLLLGFEASSALTMRLTKCGMSGNTKMYSPGLVGCSKATMSPSSIFGGSGGWWKSHGSGFSVHT